MRYLHTPSGNGGVKDQAMASGAGGSSHQVESICAGAYLKVVDLAALFQLLAQALGLQQGKPYEPEMHMMRMVSENKPTSTLHLFCY